MKLSDQTLTLLKNFASINANIVMNPGTVIKTMSESKTIMSQATITEDVPSKFGIYDLNEFLGVVNMFDSPSLDFDQNMKFVKVAESNKSVKYFFSDTSILTSPTKDITMPPCEVTFTLTSADMANIRKAASALGVTDLVIRTSPNEVAKLVVTDTEDATSNTYEVDITNCSAAGITCNFVFNISNFKFINDDYDVSISSKLLSNFKAKNNPVQYWVALEKKSTFEV
jgi:hypothetical protein